MNHDQQHTGCDLSRQSKPSIDDRIGKVAIEAMDALIGEMLAGREDADLLSSLDRIVRNYIAARWRIAQGHSK